MALVLCSLLGDVGYGKAGLLVLSWLSFVVLLQGIDRCSGAFLFYNSSLSFLIVCIYNAARVMRYCRG
jgi:hypothetical protein